MPGLTRREIIKRLPAAGSFLFGLATFMPTASRPAKADPLQHRAAIAKLGTPKEPPGFAHFDWVNPDAPKGGRMRLSSIGSFDNLNQATIKGAAAPGLALTLDSLFSASPDEPATAYALIAEWVAYPDDVSFAVFGLNPNARFQDGHPIAPEDIIFSFDEQKKASPSIALYYRDVMSIEQTGQRDVTFHFKRAGNRDLPYFVSLLGILPRHYWTGKTPSGAPRDLSNTTLEPPLGSGPYRIKAVDRGRTIVYERVKDYWAKDMPVNRGLYNFDEISFAIYRDDVPEFEALEVGEVDIREENVSRRWATGYDFPAVRDGRIKKVELETKAVAQLQAFVLNTRRPRFADPRVRHAFALAYDFESANNTLFYGLYRRINSIFENSELAQTGVPAGLELDILESVREKVPPEVFGPAYKSPINATETDLRRNLREAGRLLHEAGWKVENGHLQSAETGQRLTVEFLSPDATFDRIILPYQQNLAKLGIDLSIRVVEPTQYEQRLKTFDFDMITDTFVQSHSPGNELRELLGSDAADKSASRNRAGIREPGVDAIIERVIYARTRDELVAACRALDRVVLWKHYFTLQWYNPNSWYAYWDKFGRPARHPSQDPSVTTTWWFDEAAARRLEGRNASK
jgi:microcin C transport system substrate-binding protein